MDWLLLSTVIAATAGAATIAEKSLALSDRAREFVRRRTLRMHLRGELYTAEDIINATRWYQPQDMQEVDPSGADEPRYSMSVREPSFKALDRILDQPWQHRFLIVLGDSGMGKSTLLLNYYARHLRSRSRRARYGMRLVPLGTARADDLIRQADAASRSDTVLLLDAFDEDRAAIANHRVRLAELLALTTGFRNVVLTSRTQFFERDEELPGWDRRNTDWRYSGRQSQRDEVSSSVHLSIL